MRREPTTFNPCANDCQLPKQSLRNYDTLRPQELISVITPTMPWRTKHELSMTLRMALSHTDMSKVAESFSLPWTVYMYFDPHTLSLTDCKFQSAHLIQSDLSFTDHLSRSLSAVTHPKKKLTLWKNS